MVTDSLPLLDDFLLAGLTEWNSRRSITSELLSLRMLYGLLQASDDGQLDAVEMHVRFSSPCFRNSETSSSVWAWPTPG